MSNLDHYKDPGIEIFDNAPIPHIVYRPANQQPTTQNMREQVQLARELHAIRAGEQVGKLAFWAIAGSASLVALAIAASILKGLIAPTPEPLPQPQQIIITNPSPAPQPVQVNPNCQIFCGTGQ